MQRRLTRATGGNPLPQGTLAVGLGLIVTGLSAYGYLLVAARALEVEEYASLSVLWAMVLLVGPGVFLPLEQEVGRVVATRRAQGTGSRPVLGRAAMIGAASVVVLVGAALVTNRPVLGRLLDGDVMLFAGLLASFAGYFVLHLARGALSGNGRFGAYSVSLAAEGAVRLIACVTLAAAGVATAGPYGLILGVAPFAAVALALRGEHELVRPGPDAPWSEMSSALGWLLTGSILAQVLVNGGPLAVKLLANENETAEAGRFLTALIVARVPLFLFAAVQAALLPALAAMAGSGRLDEFRRGLRRLMVAVSGLGLAATVGAFTIGPWVVRLFFGPELALGRRDLGLLAAASAAYMVALALAQALIALSAAAQVALAWLSGSIVFLVVTALGDDLLLRTELGLLAGCVVAAGSMAAFVVSPLRADQRADAHDPSAP